MDSGTILQKMNDMPWNFCFKFKRMNTETTAKIRKLRGVRKRKPGEKPFAEEWAAHKREEMKLEEAKYARSTGSPNSRGKRRQLHRGDNSYILAS
jgi:hypothetical protein